MKIFIVILFLITLLFPMCMAVCEDGQVDINSASAEELDEITHVGEAVAGYIIEARPFNSLDELVDVKYISEGYLEDIKEQGLACVSGEEAKKENEQEDEEEQTSETEEEPVKEETKEQENNEEEPEKEQWSYKEKTSELSPINLNNKNLTDKDKTNSNLAIYGILFFCILLVFLYMRKKNNKNEFR